MIKNFKLILLLSLIISIQSQCEKTLYTNDNGVISSPNYPSRYPSQTKCAYDIVAPFYHRIRLWWDYLAIYDVMPYCYNSYVAISVGCGSKSKYLTRFCNKYESFIPHDIYSTDNCMRIQFVSSADKKNVPLHFHGFKVRYKFTYENDKSDSLRQVCSKSLTSVTDDYGLMYTPNWPLNPTKYFLTCKWRINITRGYSVMFNFMDFKLYNFGLTQLYCYSSGNYLQIEYTDYKYSKVKVKKYCGSRDPFSLYHLPNEYKYIDVSLIQPTAKLSDKLLMGYVIYKTVDESDEKDSDVNSESPWYLMLVIPGGIVVVIFYAVKLKQANARNVAVTQPSHTTGLNLQQRYNELNGASIALKSVHNCYIVAEPDGSANANRQHRDIWETFKVETLCNYKIALKSHHNKYLVAETDGTANANRDRKGKKKTFKIEFVESNKVSLKTNFNKYLVAESDGRLNANRDQRGPWEKFILEIIAVPETSFPGDANVSSSHPPTNVDSHPPINTDSSSNHPPYAPPSYQDVLNEGSKDHINFQRPQTQVGVYPPANNTQGGSIPTAPPSYEGDVNYQSLPPVNVVSPSTLSYPVDNNDVNHGRNNEGYTG